LVFDEIQKVKSPSSLVTRTAKTVNTNFTLGLTGTPIENHLADLWCIMDIIDPGRLGDLTAIVLLERALGGVATLVLAAIGFALAVGRYDVGPYLWIEGAFVLGTIVLGVLFFSHRARGPLRRFVPFLRRLRVERALRALYEGVHVFRRHVRLMAWVSLLTLGVQSVRVLAIWMAGRSVGIELSPRPYYVMGPLLFLVILVPFTINGLAVREAFFVSFLTQLGVDKESALACGFLFFVVTIALALPGAVILGVENLRGVAIRRGPEASIPGELGSGVRRPRGQSPHDL